jgi:hypothetical protein
MDRRFRVKVQVLNKPASNTEARTTLVCDEEAANDRISHDKHTCLDDKQQRDSMMMIVVQLQVLLLGKEGESQYGHFCETSRPKFQLDRRPHAIQRIQIHESDPSFAV